MINIILSSLSIIVFISYIVLILCNYGLLESISHSWYSLISKSNETKNYSLPRYFTVWCCLIPMLIIHPSLTYITDYNSYVVLLMCLGLVTVGTTPNFNNEKYYLWHNIGAITTGLCALYLTSILGFWIYTLIIMFISFIIQLFTRKKDYILWLEIGCFISYLTVIKYLSLINYE